MPRNYQGPRRSRVEVFVKPRIKQLLEAASRDASESRSRQANNYIVQGLLRDGYIVRSDTAKGKG
jgi:hypothetical protein